MKEALTKEKKYKLPEEIVRAEDVKTGQGAIKVPSLLKNLRGLVNKLLKI